MRPLRAVAKVVGIPNIFFPFSGSFSRREIPFAVGKEVGPDKNRRNKNLDKGVTHLAQIWITVMSKEGFNYPINHPITHPRFAPRCYIHQRWRFSPMALALLFECIAQQLAPAGKKNTDISARSAAFCISLDPYVQSL